MKIREISIVTLLIVFMAFAGCSETSDNGTNATCGKDYISFEGKCCLDKNADSVCDIVNGETISESSSVNFDDLTKNIVRITWKTNDEEIDGTGFFVDEKGYILTSWNLIKNYNPNDCYKNEDDKDKAPVKLCDAKFTIIDSESRFFTNHTLVSYNELYDLALIKLNTEDLALIRQNSGEKFIKPEFEDEKNLKNGITIYSFDFKPKVKAKIIEGKIIGESYVKSGIRTYKTNLSFAPKEYGLPILNQNNKIVGMPTVDLNFDSVAGQFSILNPGILKQFVENGVAIRCSPSCGLTYERFSEIVKIYKPSYIYLGRELTSKTLQSNKVYFDKFTIKIENNDIAEHTICFNAKITKNGILKQTQELFPQVTIKARQTTSRDIKVNWYDEQSQNEPAQDYYFEVNAYDCNSKDNYNQFYVRGRY